MSNTNPPSTARIRGVNLGGWLLLERYITPYLFAVTECHRRGNFCWYPGSLSAPPNAKHCSQECIQQPVLMKNVFNATDYPLDEWNLALSLPPKAGEEWVNYHFEHFIKFEDLQKIKAAGITHVRVPLPHWILGDVKVDEPWIVGARWKYFKRLCEWCRQIGLEVWPNIHTAPGSQNGFDNSGRQNLIKTCAGWNDNPKSIPRSLRVVDQVTKQIKKDELSDVVTGFGILNEPFADCNFTMYQDFLDSGLVIVRRNLGPDINVFVSDLFLAPRFNNGEWWLDPDEYNNTYLDSHYYHLFADAEREMSPKEHIAHICEPEPGQDMLDCCWQDNVTKTTTPSEGVGRIVTEWSTAYDAMPGELLKVVLESIRETGVAALQDRQLSDDRKKFLKQFAQAQIVSFEQAGIPGLNHGWFYWTLKLEGGAFAEWDFLRALQDGWFPDIQAPTVDSESVYGTCWEIYNQTTTDTAGDVIRTYPDEYGVGDNYWDPDHLSYAFKTKHQNEDDRISVAISGGDDVRGGTAGEEDIQHLALLFAAVCVILTLLGGWRQFRQRKRKWQYTSIQDAASKFAVPKV
jgi:glucan 1,3-beta-glucosidase